MPCSDGSDKAREREREGGKPTANVAVCYVRYVMFNIARHASADNCVQYCACAAWCIAWKIICVSAPPIADSGLCEFVWMSLCA